MHRLAKAVNVLAIRQVKQGTETTRFRIGYMCLRLANVVNVLAIRQVIQVTETTGFRISSMCFAWLK